MRSRRAWGSEFTEEVDRAFAEILSFPNAWPLFSARARRHHTRRFEYGILYGVFDEEIVVAAIMHLKRDPQRWQGRVRATFGDAGAGASAAA